MYEPDPIVYEREGKRAYLRQVWDEICELSFEQRAALLLGLRDERGSSVTTLFNASRIATMRKIAEALRFEIEELCYLW